jgi:hypothetical protein
LLVEVNRIVAVPIPLTMTLVVRELGLTIFALAVPVVAKTLQNGVVEPAVTTPVS